MSEKCKAAQVAAFAFASVDAALARQRAAAAAKLEAEAMQLAVEEKAAADAAAAQAFAHAEQLRTEHARALAREQQLVRCMMLERQYNARLLLRCRNQWLHFVQSMQQQRREQQRREVEAAAKTKADGDVAESEEPVQPEDDVQQHLEPQMTDDLLYLVQSAKELSAEEESVFKRVFNGKMDDGVDDLQRDVIGAGGERDDVQEGGGGERLNDSASVMIFPQSEPVFNSLHGVTCISEEAGVNGGASSPALLHLGSVAGGSAAGAHDEQLDVDLPSIEEPNPFVSYAPSSNDDYGDMGPADDSLQHVPDEACAVHNEIATSDAGSCASHVLSISPKTPSPNSRHAGSASSHEPLHSPRSAGDAQLVEFKDHDVIAADCVQSIGASSTHPASAAVAVKRRVGPKTPVLDLSQVQDARAAATRDHTFAPGSEAVFNAALPDGESSDVTVNRRMGHRTPVSPQFGVYGRIINQSPSPRNAGSPVLPEASTSALSMSIEASTAAPAFIKVGPKTPLTPVAPTRYVRQWLVKQSDQVVVGLNSLSGMFLTLLCRCSRVKQRSPLNYKILFSFGGRTRHRMCLLICCRRRPPPRRRHCSHFHTQPRRTANRIRLISICEAILARCMFQSHSAIHPTVLGG